MHLRGFVALASLLACSSTAPPDMHPTAEGGVPEQILVLDHTMADLGSAPVGETNPTPALFTVRNTGTNVTGTLTVTVTGEAFFANGGCGAAGLLPGDSCRIAIGFRPSSAGTKSGILTVSATPGGTVTASLTGDGVAPAELVVSPNLVDFADVAVGSLSDTRAVVIENANGSSTALTVTSSDPGTFRLSSDCPARLAALAACTVRVTFAPAIRGVQNGTLMVSANGLLTVALTGNGIVPIHPTIQPPSATFAGIVNVASAPVRFIVGNTGERPTGPPTVAVVGVNVADFIITTTSCLGPIASGATCSVEISFKPSAEGTRMASLMIAASPGGVAMAALTGVAVPIDGLSLSPSPLDLGEVMVGIPSVARTVTVKNTGGAATGAIAVTLASTEFTKGADTCSGVVLAPNASCTIAVAITAASAGVKSAVLVASAGIAGQGVITLTATAR